MWGGKKDLREVQGLEKRGLDETIGLGCWWVWCLCAKRGKIYWGRGKCG